MRIVRQDVGAAERKTGDGVVKVLVACEESQRVCTAFRERGHEAYSCDVIECSGGHPEWHIMQDVLPLLNGGCEFTTVDGVKHSIEGKWDLIIAFPPCTYLTSAGTRHYSLRMNSKEKVEARVKKRDEAVDFFMAFVNADCDKIAIENPVGYMNTHYRKPNQIIHPYYFGEPYQKRTCLFLKGLPELTPTNMLKKPEPLYVCKGEKCKGKAINWVEGIKGSGKERAKARSKTFIGIAEAMAEQWG